MKILLTALVVVSIIFFIFIVELGVMLNRDSPGCCNDDDSSGGHQAAKDHGGGVQSSQIGGGGRGHDEDATRDRGSGGGGRSETDPNSLGPRDAGSGKDKEDDGDSVGGRVLKVTDKEAAGGEDADEKTAATAKGDIGSAGGDEDKASDGGDVPVGRKAGDGGGKGRREGADASGQGQESGGDGKHTLA